MKPVSLNLRYVADGSFSQDEVNAYEHSERLCRDRAGQLVTQAEEIELSDDCKTRG
jgi:hypothetical protein